MTVPHLPIPGKLPDPPKLRKIALEEHFVVPVAMERDRDGKIDVQTHAAENGLEMDFFQVVYDRLNDFGTTRIESMDEAGIDYAIVSLCCPGIEGILDAREAQEKAAATNDAVAKQIQPHHNRLGAFASIATHDPEAAARELERCVTKLGFKGVLFNGFSQHGQADNLIYLDDDRCTPIWEVAQALDVPIYLHPRVSYNQLMYQGHKELLSATWGFAPETGTHALRIVYSGVFDRFPKAKLVLGHLGETLPFQAWRIQHCFEFNPADKKVRMRLQDYLSENIWVTTSGNFNTQALHCTLLTMGADRIMFSVDYPFENMDEAADFIETCPIAEGDRRKIAHGNARQFFGLSV